MLTDDELTEMQNRWRRGVPMPLKQAGQLIAEVQLHRERADVRKDLVAAIRALLADRRELWGDDVRNGVLSLIVSEEAINAADAAIVVSERLDR